MKWQTVTGKVLTSANVADVNTFKNPNKLALKAFNDARKDGSKLVVNMPSKSVVTLELN